MRTKGLGIRGELLMTPPTIAGIDLFCGCGGMTRGLIDAGIKVLVGVDKDGRLKETYEANNPPSRFVKRDVRWIKGSDFAKLVDNDIWDFVVLAGCAPCQPFSKLQKNATDQGKSALLSSFARIIEDILPDALIVENVPGLRGNRGDRVWRRFTRRVEDLGYAIRSAVVDAKNYGVPQHRNRLVLLAGRGFEIKIPDPTHGDSGSGVKNHETVRGAIGSYPSISAGQNCLTVPNHRACALSSLNLTRIGLVPHNGGSRSTLPDAYVLKCHRGRKGHTDTYGRMAWDAPSPTLTCRCTSLSNGRFGHPEQNRAISVREAAALQTFRDDYIFPDATTPTSKWIGNAVPVKMAYALGCAVTEALCRQAGEIPVGIHSSSNFTTKENYADEQLGTSIVNVPS
jgi:DNA (cytosine-5)-methyltransferase 1